MKEVTAWWSEINGSGRRWLMYGKGPTFEQRHSFDLTPFSTLAINHTIRDTKSVVSAIIDIDVVEACADAIDENADYLLIPRFPHVNCHRGAYPLESWFCKIPLLEKLDRQGRLVWYNLSVRRKVPGSPVVPPGKFSAEVITHLLALLGAREVRTCGVDGGDAYARSFDDVAQATRLANGQPDFNVQFEGISRAIRSSGIVFGPLEMQLPFPVLIGTDVESLDAAISKYSIMRSSVTADIRQIPLAEQLESFTKHQGLQDGFLYLHQSAFLTDDLRWVVHYGEQIGRCAVADDRGRIVAAFSPDGIPPTSLVLPDGSSLAPFVGVSSSNIRGFWLNLLHDGITDGIIKRKLVAKASEDGTLSAGEYWRAVRPRVSKRLKQVGMYATLRTLGMVESLIKPRPLGGRDE